MTIRELAKAAHDSSVKSGNYRASLSINEQLMGVVRHLGVASNYVRRSKPLAEVGEARGKPTGFGVLLANAVITLADISQRAGVDLEAAVIAKLNWNKRSTK